MERNQESINKIIEYLDRNIKKGYKIEDLKWALINQKHSKTEIDKAIKIIEAKMAKPKEEPQKEIEIIEEKAQIPEKKSFWQKLFKN